MLCGEDGRSEGKVGWFVTFGLGCGLEQDGWASGGDYILSIWPSSNIG